MQHDYYEILQVHPRADAAAITAAYTRLHDLYDPARLTGAADELVELARQKYTAIEQAYAVLSDPAQRAAYDAQLATKPPTALAPVLTTAPVAPAEVPTSDEIDYRPLPPAGRSERPPGFNPQPGRVMPTSPAVPQVLMVVGLLFMAVLTLTLALTGGGTTPPPPPTPTPSALDAYETYIQETQQITTQRPTDPQVWIDYGNAIYDSVQVIRESAPDSDLYRQRVPRWLQATEAYTKALALEPGNAVVRGDLGASACFYGVGTGDQRFVLQGIAESRQAARTAPTNGRIQLNLGYCLISDQPPRTDEAINSWKRVLELEPTSSPLAIEAQRLIARYQK